MNLFVVFCEKESTMLSPAFIVAVEENEGLLNILSKEGYLATLAGL